MSYLPRAPPAVNAGRMRIVIVGAGLAGVRAAETLRRLGFAGHIVLVGAERHFPPYDRPPLSKHGLASAEYDPVLLRVEPDLDLELELGQRAVALDAKARQIRLADGRLVTYDGVVIATGAVPRTLALTTGRPNAHVLRTADDAARLRAQVASGVRVVVIGAGVLGCEIAASCRRRHADVTVVDVLPQPMVRVLGSQMGGVVAQLHRKHGVELRLGRTVVAARGESAITGLELDDGQTVDADVVVVAIGATPDTDWLAGSGITIADGVVCDEACFAEGSAGTVVAAGDVARWRHPAAQAAIRVEHWTNAATQAEVAAENLLRALTGDREPMAYAEVPYVWSDQYEWKLQLLGSAADAASIEDGSVEDERFVAAYHSAGQLVGALCVNSPGQVSRWRRRLIAEARK